MNSTENTMTSSCPEAPGEITGSQSWMLFLSSVTMAAPTIAPERWAMPPIIAIRR
jgi:hypothetical protein